jgi:hypothetical protein
VAAGCSSSSNANPSVTRTPQQRVADTAVAKSILLRRSDLPRGFETKPSTSRPSEAERRQEAKCLGISDDVMAKRDADRAEALGDIFVTTLNPTHVLEAGSAVVREPSAAGLSRRFSQLTGPHGISCLKTALQVHFAADSRLRKVRIVGLALHGVPMVSVGEERAAIGGTFTLAAAGEAVDAQLAYYFVRRGRTVAEVSTVAFGVVFPPAVARTAIEKVAARLDAAA